MLMFSSYYKMAGFERPPLAPILSTVAANLCLSRNFANIGADNKWHSKNTMQNGVNPIIAVSLSGGRVYPNLRKPRIALATGSDFRFHPIFNSWLCKLIWRPS